MQLPNYDQDLPISPHIYVTASAAIAKGDLVCINGWDATNSRFKVVQADADATIVGDRVTHFIAIDAAIASGAGGYVSGQGLLTGVDTSSATAVGSPVYLSTTAGGWTLTAPTGAATVQQKCGTVTVKATAANGGAIMFYPFYSKPAVATS